MHIRNISTIIEFTLFKEKFEMFQLVAATMRR